MLQSASAAVAGLPRQVLIGVAAAIVIIVLLLVFLVIRPFSGSSEPVESQEAPVVQTYKKGEPFSFSVATTGDIIFGREVGTYVDMNGGASAMANVADQLAAADITIANIEAPLSDDESEALLTKDVILLSRPAGIESLKNSDITFASLANNHSLDYGGAGLQDTLDALDGAGIKHAGAGMTEAKATEIAETTADGASVAFFSFTDIVPDYFLALGNEPGIVSARLDMKGVCKSISEAKELYDVVIVAMHWGIEYEDYINITQQQDPAHQLVDAGADIIIGNHPHVIQGIEFYNGALISYSQGDFVFDHYSERTGESFILEFKVTDEGVKDVVATPVYLDDTYGIPDVVTGEHAQSILERLATISEGMNSSFEIKDDKAYIKPIEETAA